jgi:hypothetical protein
MGRRTIQAALVVVAALAVCGPAAAQAQVTVAQTLRAADGSLLSGYLRIRASAPFQAPDGSWIDTAWAREPLVNGRISVALWPATYTVEWHLDNAVQRTDTWTVVAGSSPVTIAAVEGIAAGAGTAGALSLATLTNAQLLATLTNAQLLAMTN